MNQRIILQHNNLAEVIRNSAEKKNVVFSNKFRNGSLGAVKTVMENTHDYDYAIHHVTSPALLSLA